MARHDIKGTSPTLFAANDGGPIGPRLLYVTGNEAGIQNSDGSRTYLVGTGLVWDPVSGLFTAGTVHAINHYTAGGAFIDAITDISISGLGVSGALLNAGIAQEILLSGDDVIDARYRHGNRAVNDHLLGHGGNDTIFGGGGHDRLEGGTGDDMLFGGQGDDIMSGGPGDDLLAGGSGVDTAVIRGLFADLTFANAGGTLRIANLLGTDQLSSVERIATDDGIWVLTVTGDWVRAAGTAGVELLDPASTRTLTSGDDMLAIGETDPWLVVRAGAGNDSVSVTNTATDVVTVLGGSGNDTLDASASSGSVVLDGNGGRDTLKGGSGRDVLSGGTGRDHLTGGGGDDRLSGGDGADMFHFDVTSRTSGHFRWETGWDNDVITDFAVGTDRLHLTGLNASRPVTIEDTADGLLLTYQLQGAFGGTTPTTILLAGVHGNYTLDDLIL